MSAKYSFISPLVFCVKILKEQKTQIKTHTHTHFFHTSINSVCILNKLSWFCNSARKEISPANMYFGNEMK